MPQAPRTALSSPLQFALHLLHRAGQRADGLFAAKVDNVLTPEGRRVWSQASPAVHATEEALLAPLAPADRAIFLKGLVLIAVVA
jgi:hypothetical protein